MIRKYFLGLLISIVFFSFFILKSAYTQTEISDNATAPKELMEQGRIRTCLSAKFAAQREEGAKGVVWEVPIRLKGTCASPSGCKCLMSWNYNISFAETNSKTWEKCDRDENDIMADLQKNPAKYRKLLQEGGEAKIKDYVRSKRNSCAKTIREASHPILSNIKPGFKECNIIKNNLATSSNLAENSSKLNILGVTDSDLIPPGPVDLTVKETIYIHTPVDFAAIGELPATVTEENLGKGGNDVTGNDASQKLGKLEFIAQQLQTTVDNLKTNCSSITWDPYGRVFDAQSLEPISDVEVTLIDDLTKKPAEMSFNLNYDITGEDGLFNIQVEKEGNYQLTVKPLTDHLFLEKPNLNPNWSKIYSDLYSPNKVFFEKTGVPTHHDIALQSKSTPYKEAVAEIVPGTMKSENFGEYVVYKGRQTFPMAKICLTDEETGSIIGDCTNANNIGNFTLVIPKNQIPQKRVIIIPEKVDLTDPNIYNNNQKKEILHMNSTFSSNDPLNKYHVFEPILSYIEGYVYNNNGERISGAQVLVKLSINNELYYQTKADDSGFFTIYSNNLPYLEYYLEFVDPKTGEKINKSTSEFVNDNKSYLDSEKVNLMTGTKYDQPVVNKNTGRLNEIDKTVGQDTSSKPTSKNKNPILTIIIFVLVILLLVVAAVVVYMKKNIT